MREQKIAHGEWTPSLNTPHLYTGTCQKCQDKVEAVKLKLKRVPFGGGELWVCPNCYYPQRKES